MPWVESLVRVVVAMLPFLKEHFKPNQGPEPIETLVVSNGNVYLDIENRGASADFTAQFTHAVNAKDWPGKMVWARWDHDKTAQNMRIAKHTKARLRIGYRTSDPKVAEWLVHWGSDWGMEQGSIVRGGGQVHIQIVVNPDSESGPLRGILFFRPSGEVSYMPRDISS
jgi:hypothetical protein